MAHLWMADRSASGGWMPQTLDANVVVLAGSARVLRHASADAIEWVLVGPPSLRVNGQPLDAGIRLLRDRDELRTGAVRTFFSTESLAVVEAFPGDQRPTFCPRCKLAIEPGTPAVRCPQCRVWHHQSDDMPCWLYAERCTLCDQPTTLDAGFHWSPEAL
jgi:hypothetical protein